MQNNKAIGTISAIVTAGSIVAICLSLTGGLAPGIDAAPHQAAGRVLARQTLSLLKPGGHLTVITRDTVTFRNPASDILFTSFRKQLGKAGTKIDSLETLQIDPLRPVEVPPGDFFQLIKNAAKGSVIVSLMGPPILTEAQLAQLGEIKPAIIAFCPGPAREQADLRTLFSKGVLQAAVVTKRHPQVKKGGHSTETEAFDQQFIEVSPANVTGLASISETAR
jgi:hypothetical protein